MLKLLFAGILIALIAGVGSRAQPSFDAQITEFGNAIGDKKYVNLGEDSHFMVEVHRFVSEAFPYLVEKKGFRVFVFESAWGIDDKFNDFLNSDRTSVNADESFFLNAFNSKYTVRLLIWIRDWNRRNPNDRVRIAGYQPEQPVTDFRELFEFGAKSSKFSEANLKAGADVCRAGTGEYRTDIEFVSATSKRRRSGQPTYTPEERSACNAAIDRIATFLAANRKELIRKTSKNTFLEKELHIKSLRTYLNTLSNTLDYSIANKQATSAEQRDLIRRVYEEGDKARFEIFEVLRRTRYRNLKVFFWMHNWHAMKRSNEVGAFGRDEKDSSAPDKAVSIGTRMAQEYKNDLYVIGNIVPKATCKNPICNAPAPRSDSLETKFSGAFGNSAAFVRGRNREALFGDAGSLYADINQAHFINVILNRQFDAILYLPVSSPTFEDQ